MSPNSPRELNWLGLQLFQLLYVVACLAGAVVVLPFLLAKFLFTSPTKPSEDQ